MLDPDRTSIAQRKKAKCPICGKPTEPTLKPFCSTRCKQVDLNRWLGEAYRIETDELPEDQMDSVPRLRSDDEDL